MRRLSEEVRGELAEALNRSGRDSALAFAEAVTLQVAHPIGDQPDERSLAAERRAARRVVELIGSAADPEFFRPGAASVVEPAARLVRHPELLAAVFQNIDLLYRDGFPDADGVSHLVMQALGAMDETSIGALPDPVVDSPASGKPASLPAADSQLRLERE